MALNMEPFWRRHTFSFYGVFSKVLALIMNFSPLSNVLVSTTTFEVQKLLRVVHKVYKNSKTFTLKGTKAKGLYLLMVLALRNRFHCAKAPRTFESFRLLLGAAQQA